MPLAGVEDRWDKTFQTYFAGNSMLITLDSGMFVDVRGEQTKWLESVLKAWNESRFDGNSLCQQIIIVIIILKL